jgi:hypothetical protein
MARLALCEIKADYIIELGIASARVVHINRQDV